MCSNFEPIQLNRAKWVEQHLKCRLPEKEWKPNVFKLQLAPFIYFEDGLVKTELGCFGLIPPWTKKDERKDLITYNARSETVDTKKSYRSPWIQRRFGIVLAEKFYEPLYDKSGKNSIPVAIFRSDGEPTAIATIWESFIDEDSGEVVRSFSMLTVNAALHPLMNKFHRPNDEKRSVVVLKNQDLCLWLKAGHDQAKELLNPSPEGYLTADLSKSISPQLSMF